MLQFVLIKPFTALITLVLEKNNIYHEGEFSFNSGYMYLAIINNMSISLSLYSLVLFYMATEERLKPYNPFSKFLCIKAILFFSFWQTCLFTVLIHINLFSKQTADLILNHILCFEMVFAALA